MHPAASPDVTESSCFAIAFMTELFPDPLSPKMTTFLARGRDAYNLSLRFPGIYVAQEIGRLTDSLFFSGDFGGGGGGSPHSLVTADVGL